MSFSKTVCAWCEFALIVGAKSHLRLVRIRTSLCRWCEIAPSTLIKSPLNPTLNPPLNGWRHILTLIVSLVRIRTMFRAWCDFALADFVVGANSHLSLVRIRTIDNP